MAQDYYELLGVSRSASQDEIKKAFRTQAHKYHPDKGGGDEAKFKEVNAAYQVLSNPEKRAKYDQFGAAFEQAGGGAGGMNWNDFARQGGAGFQSADFGDLGDIFGDLFGFGGGRRASQSSNRGADLEFRMTITLEEVASGVTKVLELDRERACSTCGASGAAAGSKTVECKTCGGSGQVERIQQSFFGAMRSVARCSACDGSGQQIKEPCPDCRGEGRRRTKQKLKVEIPAGIENGQSMRLNGEGMAGRRGNPSGDLYLRIEVQSDPRFERSGADLKTSLAIGVADAALGVKVPVETVQGQVVLTVPAGTQPGTVMKLKGKGLPHLRSTTHGDLFVEVSVKVPTKLDKKAKAAFQELRDLER